MRPIIFVLAILAGAGAVTPGGQDLFDAVKKGNAASVTRALQDTPSQLNARDRYTLTPLHWAAIRGDLALVQQLVEAGADLNARNRLNATPLDVARLHRHQAVVEWLLAHTADPTAGRWPVLEGDYLAERPPDSVARLFAPLIVSSLVTEHGAPVFTPDGREMLWAVVFDDPSKGQIMFTRRVGSAWAELRPVAFSEPRFRDVSPVLSASGSRLFFQSSRPVRAGGTTAECNIWVSDRTEDGWTEPRLLDSSLASGKDGRPLVTKDGTLYFVSWRDGVNRIYRSRPANGRYEAPVRLDADFNNDVIPAWVSDDHTRMIFESSRPGSIGRVDFWMSSRDTNGRWQEPVNLGPNINSAAEEAFASFSPDGNYFFFGSNRDGNADVYWVSADALPRGLPSLAGSQEAG